MSLSSTKAQLIQLLADKDNKVIALTGKWGTGKSYMWNEVKKASDDPAVQNALYVSLFGLSSIDQIKLKVVQSALPDAEKHPAVWEKVRVGLQGAKKVLTSIHKGFSALDELALLAVPSILKEKVIALDDIERKHAKLNVDEVLGFIDEFTQQHCSRFVLILNSDQLDERQVWNTLHEKVVDQELRLNTSSAEAFEIAIGLTPSVHADRIRTTVETCGLTNIRIIRKVIKVVNRILGDRLVLTDAVLCRVIPSTVLLSAIHYRGIEDGPSFDFVLSKGTPRDWRAGASKEDSKTEDGERKSKWDLLLNELGILGCDDFELLVVEFLQSGLFDVSKVSEIIDQYVAEADAMNARNDCNKFFERSVWEHKLTDAQLLAEATELAGRADLLDPYMVTALHEAISELPLGLPVADSALDKWIASLKARNLDEVDADNFFHRKLHPRIEAEFKSINAQAQANTTAYDACVFVAKNSSWGPRQEVAMKSATVQDMEAIIRSRPTSDLQPFMHKMLALCLYKHTYETHFGSAMDNFIEACRNIAQDRNSGRLGRLIKILFADSTLVEQLEPQPPHPTAAAHDGVALPTTAPE